MLRTNTFHIRVKKYLITLPSPHSGKQVQKLSGLHPCSFPKSGLLGSGSLCFLHNYDCFLHGIYCGSKILLTDPICPFFMFGFLRRFYDFEKKIILNS